MQLSPALLAVEYAPKLVGDDDVDDGLKGGISNASIHDSFSTPEVKGPKPLALGAAPVLYVIFICSMLMWQHILSNWQHRGFWPWRALLSLCYRSPSLATRASPSLFAWQLDASSIQCLRWLHPHSSC